jgi:hypothetical protein
MKPHHLLPVLLSTTLLAAAPPNAAPFEAIVKAHEQRTTLLRDELKAQDARIESRIEAIVAGLKSITDSKDSRTKVTRLKETTIDALRKNLEYFRQKRATLVEELRRPTWRLTDEQKQRGIEVFDEHIQKRVAQILALEKSFPTEKDYDRYTATGSGWYGTTYKVNEDFKQNQRLTARTNAQRDELIAALDQTITRLEQQNRALKTQGAPTAELAKNDALIAERRKQRAEVLVPASTSARAVGKKEAADLDSALRKATEELRREFTTLFARYHSLIAELSALNTARDALAAAEK